jgi:hypothetical protein
LKRKPDILFAAGRYTAAGIKTILTHLLSALSDSFPSAARKIDLDLPSLITFSPLPDSLLEEIKALLTSLELHHELRAYLADTALVSLDNERYARVFDDKHVDEGDRYRQSRRLKAEMLLLSSAHQLVDISDLAGHPASAEVETLTIPVSIGMEQQNSPAASFASLAPGETEASSSDDEEAMTPEMNNSLVVEPTGMDARGKKMSTQENERSLSSSLLL